MNNSEKIWIAGPCAAENYEQVIDTAEAICNLSNKNNLNLFAYRVGIWKVRSTPSGFEGVGEKALPWLAEIQQKLKVRTCVEVVNAKHVELCAKNDISMAWIGARTCVNPSEVQKIADAVKNSNFSILVKNPVIPDLKLWIGNIERFLKSNIKQVIAVHRGFSDATENVYRNAPTWKIPIELKVLMPELPILCDPSHLCGSTQWIPEVSQLALNYGFNGLMTECHYNPSVALSDKNQQLTPEQWADLLLSLTLRSDTQNLELAKYRSILENIDNQIGELLYQRMTTVDKIANLKREHHITVVQPQQWKHVVERYAKHSDDSLFQNFIEQFLELLHQSSIERQK